MNSHTIDNLVGHTPLVSLRNAPNCYVKLESYNIGGSAKTRVAYEMIQEAERQGVLERNSGQQLIEATGGNTGLGIAIFARSRGWKVKLVVPDDYSETKIKRCKKYGAEVVLSDHTLGSDSHVRKTQELLALDPDLINLNQLANPANPQAHFKGTGAEISEELGKVDVFVCGVGSGGTFTGVSRRLQETNPEIKKIVVQPRGCDVLTGKCPSHKIEGIALKFVASVFDSSLVDEIIDVDEQEVFDEYQRLYMEEGLALGYSSAANILVASKIARKYPACKVATIGHDSGDNYD